MSDPQTTRRRRRMTITLPYGEKQEISEKLYWIAVKRTAHLEHDCFRTPMQEILMSAYMKGLTDAITTLDHAGALK